MSDLSGFESYDLAANVAQFPIPILTGIGHERDDTVIDFVAHTRLKTPTAVAAFLIDRVQDELNVLESIEECLHKKTAGILDDNAQRLQRLAQRLSLFVTQYSSSSRQHLERLSARLALSALRAVTLRRQLLDIHAAQLHRAVQNDLQQHHHRLDLFEQSLALADPARILRLGFSITTKDGHIVRDAADLKPGDTLTTTFAQGTIESTVKAK